MIRILSLDDEPQMLDILSLILRRTGCEHLTTNDVYEAWGLLHTLPIHLFTQDLMRPEVDGWQFLYWMRADATLPDVPTIIITANAQPTSRARAAEDTEVNGYLAKPFRAHELLHIVDKALSQYDVAERPAKSQPLQGSKKYSENLAEVETLHDWDSEEATNALWWALRSPPFPATNLLIEALVEGENDIRFMAAKALGNIDPSCEAITRLLQALYHEDLDVRWSAALALGRQKTPRAVVPLIVALNDTHHVVRMWAALALGKIGDAQAIDPLTMALLDKEVPVREAAVLALGLLHDPRASEALGTAINDTHVIVRIMATQALSQIGDVHCVDALCVALDDSNANIRETAAEALGRIKDTRSIGMLSQALCDSVLSVSTRAAKALVAIGGPARVALFEKLSDPDPRVREVVIAALRYAQDSTIVPLLIDALRNETPTVRSMAAQALGSFHDRQVVDEAITALIATLEDEDFNVAWAAATALRRLGYTSAQPVRRSTKPGN